MDGRVFVVRIDGTVRQAGKACAIKARKRPAAGSLARSGDFLAFPVYGVCLVRD